MGYGQDIYSNIDVILLLLCAVYHGILKAPARCREIERGPGILLLVRVLWKTLADSAELGRKKDKNKATYIKKVIKSQFLINIVLMNDIIPTGCLCRFSIHKVYPWIIPTGNTNCLTITFFYSFH